MVENGRRLRLTRRSFLGAAAAGVVGLAMGSATLGALRQRAPNILVILSDDQGYADLGCYGGKVVRTPHLDKLATEGVRCTAFYATPNCSPSRAALLTGRYPGRAGVHSYLPDSSPMHLRSSEVTIAQQLKQRGYASCHVGKWHLGGDLIGGSQPTPRDFGFDHSFGTESNAEPSHRNPINFVRNGKRVGPQEGYACDLVAEEAIRWISQQHKRDGNMPWFVYACFQEPHEKLAAPEEMVASYRGNEFGSDQRDKKLPVYLASITNMDQAIGRLLGQLDKLGMRDDTLVVFMSDNGSLHASCNAPCRGVKSEVREGGIRVPSIWRWPGRLTAGSRCDANLSLVDILPTFCAAAGASLPANRKLDGINAMDCLMGRATERTDPIYSFFYRTDPAGALHDGDWKLVVFFDPPAAPLAHAFNPAAMQYIASGKPARFELYDLKHDPTETNDLSTREPDRLLRMSQAFVRLHNEVTAEGPTWQWP